jgi:hypothetical protein
MVMLPVTKKEAHFLQNRCIQARSVLYSNVRGEPQNSPRRLALQSQLDDVDRLIIKLTEATQPHAG